MTHETNSVGFPPCVYQFDTRAWFSDSIFGNNDRLPPGKPERRAESTMELIQRLAEMAVKPPESDVLRQREIADNVSDYERMASAIRANFRP